jgi:hypothetical protein
MGGRRAFAAALIAACTAAGLACNLLSGASDLKTSDDDEEAGVINRVDGPDGGKSDAPAPPPTCACVSAVPAEWQGPFALLETASAAGAADSIACPTGLISVLDGGAEPASPTPCTPCSCGAPVGSCAVARVQVYGGTGCNNECQGLKTVGTTCAPLTYCSATSSATAVGAVDSGTCAPDGGRLVAPSWGRTASACAFAAPPDTACGAGQACAPKSAGAPNARTCILHTGTVECPAGPYDKRVVYAGKIVDTRSCGACTCAPPTGNCSAGTLSVYVDDDCGNQTKDIPTSGACTGFNDSNPNGSGKLIALPQLLDGGCAPQGGKLLADGGALSGADPTTLCCL